VPQALRQRQTYEHCYLSFSILLAPQLVWKEERTAFPAHTSPHSI